jgi:hypothetical protein
MWCEDDVWGACPACGVAPVRYTLAEAPVATCADCGGPYHGDTDCPAPVEDASRGD